MASVPPQSPGQGAALTFHRPVLIHRLLMAEYQALARSVERVGRSGGSAAIHAARVASRRMRVMLRFLRRECHPLLAAELRFELRNLGRLLAPVREADVRKHLMRSVLRGPPSELDVEVALVMAALDQQRTSARHELRKNLRAPRWRKCLQRIQEIPGDERLIAAAPARDSFAVDRHELHASTRKLRKKISALCRDQQISKVHKLRIRAKTLRYRSETLAAISGQQSDDDLTFLRRLQTILGGVHDCHQLQLWCNSVPLNDRVQSQVLVGLARLSERNWRKLVRLHASHQDSAGRHRH